TGDVQLGKLELKSAEKRRNPLLDGTLHDSVAFASRCEPLQTVALNAEFLHYHRGMQKNAEPTHHPVPRPRWDVGNNDDHEGRALQATVDSRQLVLPFIRPTALPATTTLPENRTQPSNCSTCCRRTASVCEPTNLLIRRPALKKNTVGTLVMRCSIARSGWS